MKIANDVTELIGNTPLVRINTFGKNALILAKAEFLNPSHSVKDRIAWQIVKDALSSGKIDKNSVLIEPTSGNTGVGLAMIAAKLGMKLILTMPSSMSIERQKLMAASTPNSFIPSQFDNPSNPKAHFQSTGPEIWEQSGGKVDILVAGFGTGGTLSGTAKFLKSKNPNLKAYGVEPASSPLLTCGSAGGHKIQGIGANFIPDNLDRSVIDGFLSVENDDAFAAARQLAQKEGLLVGISSGANVYAAARIAAKPENKGKVIVTILCDTGERYLSTELFK